VCELTAKSATTTSYKAVKLQDTEWSDDEAMKRIMHHFDRNAKRKVNVDEHTCDYSALMLSCSSSRLRRPLSSISEATKVSLHLASCVAN
jgi:hypothetical protein